MDTSHASTPATPADDLELSPDDPRAAFAGAVRTARAVMGAIDTEQGSLPTPCDAMSVAQLCEHLVMVNRRVALAGRGVPVAQWPVDAADVAAGGWLDAFTAAAHEVQQAWPTAVLDEPRDLPWGTFPGRDVLAIYTNELTVHTWDLARATGQQPAWDDAVLEVSWAAIRAQLPDAERGPMWAVARQFVPEDVPWEDPFADAVVLDDDAPLIDRLVGWNGRTP